MRLLFPLLLAGCPKAPPAAAPSSAPAPDSTPATAPAAAPAPASTGERERPALAVLIVVDQLPVRLLNTPKERYQAGLARLTGDQAAVWTGHYAHAITYTCPGHATISTGAAPSTNGIVSNDWYRPPVGGNPGERVYCGDPAFLRVGTLADRVREGGGRVASVALKDRAAMMLGGTGADLLAWYDRKAGAFTAPLQDVPIEPHLQPWEALFPEDYQTWVGPDDGPRERDPRIGTTFPHAAPSAADLLYTPHAGEALVDAVLAATDRLALGTHEQPDLLTLSFSQTDYIGHAFTAESWEAMDGMIRLDRSIGRLIDGLEERVGQGRVTVVLTSDHGSSIAAGLHRIPSDAVDIAANQALAALGIEGEAVFDPPSLWLPPLDEEKRAEAARAVAKAVSAVEGIGGAYAWRVDPVEGPNADAVKLSLDAERSGDVYVLRGADALFDYPGSEGLGTSHGTPFAFDTEVPVLAWGTGIVAGSRGDADVRQVAPTVAALLGVAAPEGAEKPAIAGMMQ